MVSDEYYMEKILSMIVKYTNADALTKILYFSLAIIVQSTIKDSLITYVNYSQKNVCMKTR